MNHHLRVGSHLLHGETHICSIKNHWNRQSLSEIFMQQSKTYLLLASHMPEAARCERKLLLQDRSFPLPQAAGCVLSLCVCILIVWRPPRLLEVEYLLPWQQPATPT